MAERHEEELRGTKAFFPTAVAGLTDVASPSKPCVVTVISFSSKAIDFLPRTPMTAAVSPCCCGCFCCAGTPGAEPVTLGRCCSRSSDLRCLIHFSLSLSFSFFPCRTQVPSGPEGAVRRNPASDFGPDTGVGYRDNPLRLPYPPQADS